jgi:hypothetical protein
VRTYTGAATIDGRPKCSGSVDTATRLHRPMAGLLQVRKRPGADGGGVVLSASTTSRELTSNRLRSSMRTVTNFDSKLFRLSDSGTQQPLGADAAYWLHSRHEAQGIKAEAPLPEDFGWCAVKVCK